MAAVGDDLVHRRGQGCADGFEEDLEAEATRIAQEGARLARSAGFGARPMTAGADPIWRGIVDFADAQDASILVLGSHGRNGVGLVLMGTIADAVARHTERPVLIVHGPPAEASA
jgi:nucleotide-binding universal stress UspA family protein